MRNRLPACSSMLTLLTAIPLATCFAVAEADEPPTTLSRSYIDDDDQRRLADLQFSVDQATGRSLRISIRATGPSVEPIGGFRGLQGSNRYTAEELDLVLRGRHESVVMTRTETGDLIEGRITAGEFGKLTERRVFASGEIDFQHQTVLLPLSIHVDTSSSSSDWLQTSVIIDGQPRLSCRYRIRNGLIVDLRTDSLGHDGYIAQEGPGAKRGNRWFTATADDVTSPVEKSEWEKRDIEGRWVLMMSKLDKEPAAISKWVAWLAQEKQFELLEWLAIYQADAFKSHGVGKALLAADAPGWIRIAAWHRNSSPYMGHGRQQAGQMLLEANPAVVEDWIMKHRENLDNWEPSLSSLYGQLGSDDIVAKDSSSYDGPFQPMDVFALLDSPQKIEVFGDRLKAEAEVVYEHQVVRAISAVAISGRRSDELKKKIGKLIDHSSERIRIEAMLAHSFLLPESSLERPSRFLQIVDDESESAAIRQAALLGVSYQNHPSLILKLHTVAGEPDHPAWESAISRIGDIGRGYSVIILNALAADQLDQTQAELLKDALKRIAERELKRRDGAYQVAELIRLASIAKAENHVYSGLIFDWVKSSGKSLDPKSLGQLEAKYSVEQLGRVRPIWAADCGTKWHQVYADLLKDVIAKERG